MGVEQLGNVAVLINNPIEVITDGFKFSANLSSYIFAQAACPIHRFRPAVISFRTLKLPNQPFTQYSTDLSAKKSPKSRSKDFEPAPAPDCRGTIKDLIDRFLISASFPDTLIKDLSPLETVPKVIYAGFDPTASSLHIGHLLVVNALLHFYAAGFDVIALVGGATAKLGDPSGRLTERHAIDSEVIKANSDSIREQLERLFRNFREHILGTPDRQRHLKPVSLVDNAAWYENVDVVRFIAEIGPHFRLKHLLGKDCVRLRASANEGMNFAEFSYQLFQAYDWMQLHKKYGCRLQLGGVDQIGNMHSGHDLIQATGKLDAFGLAVPLLLDAKGQKLGKSTLDGNQTGMSAVWLDPVMTTPFEFYQHFLRSADADVAKFLHLLTFLPLKEVESISAKHDRNPEMRIGQTAVANQATLLVHGPEGLASAKRCTDALYRGSVEKVSQLSEEEFRTTFSGAPMVDLQYRNDVTLLEVLMNLPFYIGGNDSKAIEAIRTGGISVNYQKIREPNCILVQGVHMLPNGLTLIRVGKKNYFIVRWH